MQAERKVVDDTRTDSSLGAWAQVHTAPATPTYGHVKGYVVCASVT